MAVTVSDDKLFAIGQKYRWDVETVRRKIARTQEILFPETADAVAFLLETMSGKRLICDGCNVRVPFEHRCHGIRSEVNGVQTGRQCECDDCFVVNELGLN